MIIITLDNSNELLGFIVYSVGSMVIVHNNEQ